jgi:cytochrome c oxidase subunit 2
LNLDDLSARGRLVYERHCASCHYPNGEGISHVFPPITNSQIANGPVEEYIRLLLNGKPGTPKVAFNYLLDIDIAAVVTYTRNALGNHVGDFAKPEQVKQLRVN